MREANFGCKNLPKLRSSVETRAAGRLERNGKPQGCRGAGLR